MTVAEHPAGKHGRRERRREAMIAAARALFLERGYDAVTLGDIVRRSGGSLTTLYDLFENKAGLLGAIVAAERFEGLERLDAIAQADAPAAATLRAIAVSIQHDLTRPEVIGIMRIVMAEALRSAEFAHAVYRNAHLPRAEWLTALFARWAARGQARIAEPEMAAGFFLGLILHTAQMRALLGAPMATADHDLAGAVELFVAGYAITGGARA